MKRILIFYSHFYPAFKAGGPVQSLINLVDILRPNFEVFVVCSAFDVNENAPLKDILPDKWNAYLVNVQVYYAKDSAVKSVKSAFKEIKPDLIYINGMFLPVFNWLPLWLARRQRKRIIMAPRGMLQTGALAIRPTKKKIFLQCFKLLGFHKQILWHATDEQEKRDVVTIFGNNASVEIAPNIPKKPLSSIAFRDKEKGQLRMVYLSLITEKKNLHLILEALKLIETPIEFDIFGPIKDAAYWASCSRLLEKQIHKITYKGIVTPSAVQTILANYHVFILPTKGENFGHAIYEAFSVGTPALITQFTPWGKLQEVYAGVTVDSEDKDDWIKSIKLFIDLDQSEFTKLSQGAYALAVNYFNTNNFQLAYNNLFER